MGGFAPNPLPGSRGRTSCKAGKHMKIKGEAGLGCMYRDKHSALASLGLVRPSALHPKRDYKISGALGFRKSPHPLGPSSHTQTLVLRSKRRLLVK